MRTPAIVILAALATFPMSGTASAESARDVLVEVARCADLAEAPARLACFDAAATRAKAMLATPAAEPDAKKSWLDWFGFAKPQKPVTKQEDFGKPPQAEPGEITRLTATVTEFAKTGRGKALFILDNGQVWRQLDSDGTEIPYPSPGKPLQVAIEIGMLGSYNLEIEGRNGLIKVTRLK